MQKDRSFWPEWAQVLRRWGLTELIAALLEAASPLNVFLAQAVFASQPLFGQVDCCSDPANTRANDNNRFCFHRSFT